jgi:hypothetical protein
MIRRQRHPALVTAVATLCGALLLFWPALVNRFPLFYPDSVFYLFQGPWVWRHILFQRHGYPFFSHGVLYSLGIFAADQDRSVWLVVVEAALLTAFILWLVFRTTIRQARLPAFLALVAVLSLGTTIAWFVCIVLPDILGPVAYLCIYLIVFAWEKLSRPERAATGVILVWGLVSHPTHLVIGLGLCALLALLLIVRLPPLRGRGRTVLVACALWLTAAGALLVVHRMVNLRASLTGDRAPYIMARFIADGPARRYLKTHCPQLHWVACRHVDTLALTSDQLLWEPNGIRMGLSHDDQDEVQREEMPLVIGTLREYPGQQFQKSWNNFMNQLVTFLPVYLVSPYPLLDTLDTAMPGSHAGYALSRQGEHRNFSQPFLGLERWVMIAAVAGFFVLLPLAWRRKRWQLVGMAVIVPAAVIANAFLCGVLSELDGRYQGRVIWILPLLTLLLAIDQWSERRAVAKGP